MSPDEEVLPTITKWPFHLGDALLVGLAVTIAFLEGWQLNGIQLFACVLAVALGATLLVLPFVVEFLMFAREEKEDRVIELQLLAKQLESFESTLLKQRSRLEKLESRSGLDDQRYELLTSAIDQKTQAQSPDLSTFIKRVEAIEKSATKAAETSPAIKEKQDSASKAVSRIIDPGNTRTQKKPEAQTEKTQKPETEDATTEIYSDIEQLPEDFSVSLTDDLMMDDALFEMQDGEASKKSTRKKAHANTPQLITTTIAVSKLMGIGNKPFLRGSAAGLNWDKGIEMDFQEIGKWTWSLEIPENEVFELQVYRNDKDADRKGKFTLTAGQELEIEPEF